MKTILRVVLSGVCALSSSVFAQESATSLEFAAGRTEIVIAAGAPKTVEYAAREACDILGQALGRRPEIVRAPRAGYSSIVLGDNEWSRAAGIDVQALTRDAFVIRAVGTRLYVVGRDDPHADLPGIVAHGSLGNLEFERATLFGVYEFLDRYVGVRFYFPGELGTVVPRTDAVAVPKDIDLMIAPAFTVRSFQMLGDGAVPGETNTVRWVPTSYGGDIPKDLQFQRQRWKIPQWLRLRLQTESIPCCHGQRGFDYPHRFAKTHPEYFALSKRGPDGKYVRDISDEFVGEFCPQLCHSSAVWDEFFLDAKAYLTGQSAESRGIRLAWDKSRYRWNSNVKGGRFVDVMPQDGMPQCHCEKCEKAAAEAPEGQFAVELIWGQTARLANRLKAEGIKGIVTQMAYESYRAVPKCEIPENVWVMVAETGPWAASNDEALARDVREVKAWYEKLGHKVWMWTYPSKFGRKACLGIPDMAPRAWVKAYRAFAPYSMGSFCETECEKSIYHYLNYYLFSKLSWAGEVDENAVLDEHFRLMFGAAAGEMAEFYGDLERKWTTETLMPLATAKWGRQLKVATEDRLRTDIYRKEVCDGWNALFDSAAAKLRPGSLEARRLAFIRWEFLDPIIARTESYAEMTDVNRPHPHDAAKNMLVDSAASRTIVVTHEQKPYGGRIRPQSGTDFKFTKCFKPATSYLLSYDFELESKHPEGTFFTQYSCGPGQWINVQSDIEYGGQTCRPAHREYYFKTPAKIGPENRHYIGFFLTGEGKARIWNVHLEETEP